MTMMVLAGLLFAAPSWAGNSVNAATTGAAGTAISISNATPTQLIKANTTRVGWTLLCTGAAGTIAALMMPGDSLGNAASPAPSQTVGFPILANTYLTDQDFGLRGLDALHQRWDAEEQGGAPGNCYTMDEQ